MNFAAEETILAKMTDATCRAIKTAEIYLPKDVKNRLIHAYEREQVPVAREILGHILQNIQLAEEMQAPICQDTGIPVFYLTLPDGFACTKDMRDAILAGIIRATEQVPLRPNLVDPETRHNTNNNVGIDMPPIHILPGETCTITVLPKGAGSENVSRIKMFLPAEKDGIQQFVTETVLLAGGKPCPPIIVGVGIGGTFDTCAALAKEALLEPIDTMTPQEEAMCDEINRLGIGPMGLGGTTTCLAVKIKKAGCHTASLPVAVNIQCWACRRATEEISGGAPCTN